jgi:hypothetical protein
MKKATLAGPEKKMKVLLKLANRMGIDITEEADSPAPTVEFAKTKKGKVIEAPPAEEFEETGGELQFNDDADDNAEVNEAPKKVQPAKGAGGKGQSKGKGK